jgi:hypothetical protein
MKCPFGVSLYLLDSTGDGCQNNLSVTECDFSVFYANLLEDCAKRQQCLYQGKFIKFYDIISFVLKSVTWSWK